MTNDTYSIAEASKFLGRDLESVMRLVESGQLPSTQAGPDGEVFISGRSLTKYAISSFGKPR